MNCTSYEEIAIGQSAEFSKEITSDMMECFLRISGDENPLHNNEEYAISKGYSDRVVFGMLTASLYSTLAGVYLPGKRCLLQSVHADFIAPVFIGDTLVVKGKVAEKHDSVRQIVIKAEIRNQQGKKVSKAKLEAGVI